MRSGLSVSSHPDSPGFVREDPDRPGDRPIDLKFARPNRPSVPDLSGAPGTAVAQQSERVRPVRTSAAIKLISSLAISLGSAALAGGCSSSQEGTSAAFDPVANKKQQDAMRAFMEKSPPGVPGQAGSTKK
jgi:hypothetical protein